MDLVLLAAGMLGVALIAWPRIQRARAWEDDERLSVWKSPVVVALDAAAGIAVIALGISAFGGSEPADEKPSASPAATPAATVAVAPEATPTGPTSAEQQANAAAWAGQIDDAQVAHDRALAGTVRAQRRARRGGGGGGGGNRCEFCPF